MNKNYKETNIKQGFGTQKWNDGAEFKGYFFNNKANGFGRFKHIDGDDYAGNFFEFFYENKKVNLQMTVQTASGYINMQTGLIT